MRYLIRALALCSLLFAIVFGVLAFKEYEPIAETSQKMEILKQVAVKKEDVLQLENENTDEITNDTTKPDSVQGSETDTPLNRVIDFLVLKKVNEDIVGWIYIPGTSVDYPILIGDRDDTYLYKDFEGKDNKAGSIFSYADTHRELWDARTILFGHNMKHNLMFGELKKYMREDNFRKEHRKIYIYTEKSKMELEIFSVFVCDNTDDILQDTTQLGSFEYQKILEELSARNQCSDIGQEKVMEQYHNRTFSLVTCWGSAGSTKRLVVSGIVSRERYVLS